METSNINGQPWSVVTQELNSGNIFFTTIGDSTVINCDSECYSCPWDSASGKDCIVGPKDILDRMVEHYPERIL